MPWTFWQKVELNAHESFPKKPTAQELKEWIVNTNTGGGFPGTTEDSHVLAIVNLILGSWESFELLEEPKAKPTP